MALAEALKFAVTVPEKLEVANVRHTSSRTLVPFVELVTRTHVNAEPELEIEETV